jgi:putative copper export protein
VELADGVTVSWQPFAVAHLTLAAVWLGSMAYSLGVVQPKPVLP